MPDPPNELTVNRAWQDATCGTGEVYYDASDGSLWKTRDPIDDGGTGQLTGRTDGSRIYIDPH